MTASTAAPSTAATGPNKTPSSLTPPPQWPKEVVEQYEPIRRLGKGGFASVMLARQRSDGKTLVAMKVVGSAQATKQEHGYAHREVDILRELSHPNIMKVLDFWELKTSKSKAGTKGSAGQCAAVMALSYNAGPTLQKLLDYGGALSLVFGRVVIAQLVDALAYCHSRAVVHRDIKPDNVVVTGASLDQDELWDDITELPPQDASNTEIHEYWQSKCRKWHVTLLDFGFARALSPQDLEKEAVKFKSAHKVASTPNNLDESRTGDAPDLDVSNWSRQSRFSLDKSVSHALKRNMSALGNRMYAAPEIVNGVHDKNSSRHSILGRSNGTHGSNRSSGAFDITKTLSLHVSNYGMLADAFSLGNTMKHLMTGVPPNEKVSDYIRQQNDPLVLLCRWMGKHVCTSSTSAATQQQQQRAIQYRKVHQLPEELWRLIQGTTHPSVAQRTSVRAARRYTYVEQVIDDASTGYDDDNVQAAETSHQIHFLHCTLKGSNKNKEAESPHADKNAKTPIMADNIVEEPSEDQETIGLEL